MWPHNGQVNAVPTPTRFWRSASAQTLLQRAIGKLHSQVFYDWLKTPLDNQWTAVKHHLLETGPALEIEVRVALFADYIPESAELPERQLFEVAVLQL